MNIYMYIYIYMYMYIYIYIYIYMLRARLKEDFPALEVGSVDGFQVSILSHHLADFILDWGLALAISYF